MKLYLEASRIMMWKSKKYIIITKKKNKNKSI